MKVLVIPDIHQSTSWQKIFDSGIYKDYDRIVQLGDWFDSWENNWKDNAPIRNFNKAIELSNKLGNFDILLGNHDMSYLGYDHCSGFQSYKLNDIRKTLQDAEPYMNICVKHNDWIFSHAGISREWVKNHFKNISDDPIKDINDLYHINFKTWFKNNEEFIKKANSYTNAMTMIVNKKIRYDCSKSEDDKKYFTLSERDNILLEQIMKMFNYDNVNDLKDYIDKAHAFDFNGFNCYGDDPWQGPLWIRPSSLTSDDNMFFNKQCVGHTEMVGKMPKIIDIQGKETDCGDLIAISEKCRLVIVDNEKHDCFTEIDTDTDKAILIKIN